MIWFIFLFCQIVFYKTLSPFCSEYWKFGITKNDNNFFCRKTPFLTIRTFLTSDSLFCQKRRFFMIDSFLTKDTFWRKALFYEKHLFDERHLFWRKTPSCDEKLWRILLTKKPLKFFLTNKLLTNYVYPLKNHVNNKRIWKSRNMSILNHKIQNMLFQK